MIVKREHFVLLLFFQHAFVVVSLLDKKKISQFSEEMSIVIHYFIIELKFLQSLYNIKIICAR